MKLFIAIFVTFNSAWAIQSISIEKDGRGIETCGILNPTCKINREFRSNALNNAIEDMTQNAEAQCAYRGGIIDYTKINSKKFSYKKNCQFTKMSDRSHPNDQHQCNVSGEFTCLINTSSDDVIKCKAHQTSESNLEEDICKQNIFTRMQIPKQSEDNYEIMNTSYCHDLNQKNQLPLFNNCLEISESKFTFGLSTDAIYYCYASIILTEENPGFYDGYILLLQNESLELRHKRPEYLFRMIQNMPMKNGFRDFFRGLFS